jgi:hypothetical protein
MFLPAVPTHGRKRVSALVKSADHVIGLIKRLGNPEGSMKEESKSYSVGSGCLQGHRRRQHMERSKPGLISLPRSLTTVGVGRK